MSDRIEKLSDLMAARIRELASDKVYSQKTTYPKFVRFYLLNYPILKLKPGMEAKIKPALKNSGIENDSERSMRRAKRRLQDYCLCNPFEDFATFTFKDDRQNIAKCKSRMSDWIKNQQRRKGKFDYLIVPEFHKDKESLHFHGLFNNYKGELIDSGIKQNGKNIYNFKSYTLGWSTVTKIKSQERTSSYLRKYITKDMPQLFGENRYWASSGLKLPITEDNPKDLHLYKNPFRTYENEYGVYLFFPIDGEKEVQ
jgi:hypothetical protein